MAGVKSPPIMPGEPDMVLVDVREVREREVSAISGAITNDQLANYLAEHPENKVVVYCTIGYRSGKLTRALTEKGIETYEAVW